jgi:DNA uptake protein ComE-like DNA-binding protein
MRGAAGGSGGEVTGGTAGEVAPLDLGEFGRAGVAAPAHPVAPADTPTTATASGGLPVEWHRLRVFGGVALGVLLVASFALAGWQFWRGRTPATVAVQPLGATAGSGADIRVQVAGAVASPGVYRLAQGDRVEDAVRAAGGLAPDADESRLNLAQRVRDEQRLDVPFAPQPKASTAPAARTAASPAPAPAETRGVPAQPDQAPPPAPAAPNDNAAGAPAAPDSNAPPPNAAEPAGQPAQAAQPPTAAPRPSATARPQATAKPSATPKPRATARPSATARPARPTVTPQPTARPDGKVDVNTATAAQLETLPGIGEVSASPPKVLLEQPLLRTVLGMFQPAAFEGV